MDKSQQENDKDLPENENNSTSKLFDKIEKSSENSIVERNIQEDNSATSESNITQEVAGQVQNQQQNPENVSALEQNIPKSDPTTIPPVTNTPGIIVLQWVTYAFWGWTVLTMSFLTAAVIAYFINDTGSGDLIIYGLAGIGVLMPISIICDFFYKKHEPAKKSGAASIVMVIHAVIFAIFGVGAIIAAVFSVVALMLATGPTQSYYTTIFSSIIIAFLYGATLLRTLNPRKAPWVRRFFSIFMVIVVGIIGVIGILGPFMGQKTIKNDKLKEQAIYSTASDIDNYVSNNHELPTSLDSAKNNATGDSKALLDNGSISYRPLNDKTTRGYSSKDYYYELCATFDKATNNTSSKKDTYLSSELYSPYHDAGKYCYQIKATDYNPAYNPITSN